MKKSDKASTHQPSPTEATFDVYRRQSNDHPVARWIALKKIPPRPVEKLGGRCCWSSVEVDGDGSTQGWPVVMRVASGEPPFSECKVHGSFSLGSAARRAAIVILAMEGEVSAVGTTRTVDTDGYCDTDFGIGVAALISIGAVEMIRSTSGREESVTLAIIGDFPETSFFEGGTQIDVVTIVRSLQPIA